MRPGVFHAARSSLANSMFPLFMSTTALPDQHDWHAMNFPSGNDDLYSATDAHVSIPLGIFIGLLASFVQSLGLTIQRKSHVINEGLPEGERKVEHRRPYVAPSRNRMSALTDLLGCGL